MTLAVLRNGSFLDVEIFAFGNNNGFPLSTALNNHVSFDTIYFSGGLFVLFILFKQSMQNSAI